MNDTGDTDSLAAEYVLGTLESGERTQAHALLGLDHGFADKVRMWERRLSELHLMVEPIEPDGKIWERIKPKIPGASESAAAEPAAVEPAEASTASEEPQPSEPADDMTPSGVFDELPTSSAAAIPTAPQLPPFVAQPAPLAADTPSVVPPAPPSPVVAPPAAAVRTSLAPSLDKKVPAARGRGGLWKALTAVMTLIVLGFVGLFAAWRFAPERLPAPLRPLEVMRELGVAIPVARPLPPPRPPAPPESRYDE
jgi:hypothetical protein